jgi:hypothetical protein
MRINFLSRLALLVGAAFLVVVTQAWSGGTLEWLFIVGGVAMLALAAVDFTAARAVQRSLDAAVVVIGIWSIIQALVFSGSTREWISFATAVAAGLVAIAGLVVHELSTERVVHELAVTPARERTTQAVS